MKLPGWDAPKVSAWDAPDASAWDVPDVAAFDGPVPGWDDGPVTAGDGLGDVSANDTSRPPMVDVLRWWVEGPKTCYVCGSRGAVEHRCALHKLGAA